MKIKKSLMGHPVTETARAKFRERTGEKSSRWRGGITPINMAIRNSFEYKLWRKAVFERDNYTCIWCGAKSGQGKTVILNSDHIKPFAYYPELRFAIDNGRTLCKPCHKTTDTYLNKGKQYRVDTDTCMCIMDAKPWDFIPVLDVRKPYCLKCGKSILAVEEVNG